MQAHKTLIDIVLRSLKEVFNIHEQNINIQFTKKEFNGDYTITLFQYAKAIKKNPDEAGALLGEYLKTHYSDIISDFQVVKGFLNLTVSDEYLLKNFFTQIAASDCWGYLPKFSSGKEIMLEYSSPNTNKPIHLGHVRNNLLGWSVAEILKTQGHKVIKANLINDRGIHICKSMLAWQKWGNGETPESANIKGDHLIGKYYVLFDKAYKQQINELVQKGITKEEAEKQAPIIIEAQNMLRQWEAGDKAILELWKTMNNWVYQGFEETYKRMGLDFDKLYYESQTYLLGKSIIEEGVQKNVFYKSSDGSVRIDLTSDGLDEKVLLRSDGTSVYITQDIGTAVQRFKEYPQLSQLIYTVGNEQDYHFKVLFKILEKLGYAQAKECYHLSYGMVELPSGKMKSREGTIVDADDLMNDMYQTAKTITEQLGKVNELSETEKDNLFEMIGMGALKYFILKVDPKKKMLFNPEESVDFEGHTGPFIQYVHARIKSLLKKSEIENYTEHTHISLQPEEREIIKHLLYIPDIYRESATQYNPAVVANDVYELAKKYNRFYQACSILKETNEDVKNFRLNLSYTTAKIIKQSLSLLGMQTPNRM